MVYWRRVSQQKVTISRKLPLSQRLGLLLILTMSIIIIPCTWATEYEFHPDPHSHVLEKIENQDITFFGTTHKWPPILDFLSGLIPKLQKVGVTHILFEIPSDQQTKLVHFLKTGEGLNDIILWPTIDCPEYRNLFDVIRNFSPAEKFFLFTRSSSIQNWW